MKKLILSLLIFCSAFATAQISIPQVTGLPAALNSKVDKVTGKSLVADTLSSKIQPHVTNFSNPHSVTKAQVGLSNVDNTSDASKPISSATQTALDGKQPIGTYATGTGTASGINTGDETTASIKTKLGAASWVSEGYITYDDYLWFSSKEPGNANIQAHISSTSNPHSVTKNQVGLGNVDNTSDANKPVSTAMQTALNSKQASGTYSTDIHGNITALNAVLGTNTGDETLTSIKTKLGAASAVSDGYLKYQDFALLHTPTTVAAANGLSISGQNISLQNASLTQSGALTFNDWNTFNSKEPAITKNSGFNKNFGTTTGTVLEGRTFGTAANSAVGDFIQNQNSSAQAANIKINGSIESKSARFGFNNTSKTISIDLGGYALGGYGDYGALLFNANAGQTTTSRKWLITNAYKRNKLALIRSIDVYTVPSIDDATGNISSGILDFYIDNSGEVIIPSTTQSTSPTTGALVVNGGVGADHVRANNFYGSGSNLTGVQLPITLTTNGTSGAATFSGNVLNVPNYDASGGVNQIQIAVWGSTGGSMICSMPFQTSSYKKVIIRFNNLSGDATYYFPTPFTIDPSKSEIYQQVGTFGTGGGWGPSSYTIKGTKGLSGWVILEGY